MSIHMHATSLIVGNMTNGILSRCWCTMLVCNGKSDFVDLFWNKVNQNGHKEGLKFNR